MQPCAFRQCYVEDNTIPRRQAPLALLLAGLAAALDGQVRVLAH